MRARDEAALWTPSGPVVAPVLGGGRQAENSVGGGRGGECSITRARRDTLSLVGGMREGCRITRTTVEVTEASSTRGRNAGKMWSGQSCLASKGGGG